MPTLARKHLEIAENPPLMRLFFYGSPKTRKTWLAGTAAEAGFNTILLDSDHGYHILLKQLSQKAQERLMVIDARDSLKIPTAANFLTRFLRFGFINFNESTRSIVTNSKLLTSSCIQLSVETHLDSNTVLIIDSYTALVRSLQLAFQRDNGYDPTESFDPKKPGVRDSFGWTGALASWMLEKVTQLPCHIIVIGHKTVYEKYSKDQKTVEWVRTQIKSTSGPHSMTIGDKFSDILYFENVSSSMTKISTRPEKDQEGGCRLIPPASYAWEKLQFSDICTHAGIHLPSSSLSYLNFSIPEPKEPLLNQKQDANNISVKKPSLTKIKI